MTDAELADATYWATFWSRIEHWMFLGVVITLALEFVAQKFAEPHKQKIDDARTTEIARLTQQAETLRNKNFELEKAFAPRVLEQNLTARRLAKFKDITFIVASPSDFESKRAAGQIRFMLRQAGWKQYAKPLTGPPLPFFDGVTIHLVGLDRNDAGFKAAGDELVAVLNENGIEAKTGAPRPHFDESGRVTQPEFSRETGLIPQPLFLLVEVGPKPLPASLQIKPEIPGDEKGNKMWGNIDE